VENIIKKENFRDYTKGAYETFQHDVHEAGRRLKEDGHMCPEKERNTRRRIRQETLILVLFLFAAVVFCKGKDTVTLVLMSLEAVLYFVIVGQGIAYLWRGRKSYEAAMRLMEAFDVQKDTLGLKEFSQIHAIARQVLENRGMTPECDREQESVFFTQKALCQSVKENMGERAELIGYSEREKTAFLELQFGDGEKTVVPVVNCDCVMEERNDIQLSIHSWATILRVPAHMEIPRR
jgi:hypothetical protein